MKLVDLRVEIDNEDTAESVQCDAHHVLRLGIDVCYQIFAAICTSIKWNIKE